jgi:hypothetical protein
MSKTLRILTLLAAAVLVSASVPVLANEAYDSSVSSMLAEQSQRIQQLETQLASMNEQKYLHAEEGEGYDCCDRCPGFIGGVEITFMKPHNNALDLIIAPNIQVPLLPEFDFEIAPRIWLGYEFAGGLGLRATWWDFDHAVAVVGIISGMEANTLDVELTQTGSFCKWDLTMAGGVRYGRIEESLESPGFIGLSHEFEGVGGTLGLSARRPVGSRGFALIAGVRGSLLFGQTDSTLSLPFIPAQATLRNTQHMLEIYEMKLGGEWSRDLDYGARFYTQLTYEAQAWNMAPIALGLADSQIGFSGVAFNIGIAR